MNTNQSSQLDVIDILDLVIFNLFDVIKLSNPELTNIDRPASTDYLENW